MAILKPDAALPDLFGFTHGLDVDVHLAPFEVRVQIAWIEALRAKGLLADSEAHTAATLLREALNQIQNQTFAWKIEDEDIHMNLERFVTEHAGALGKKIHLGRSRNDLIATTLRLWTHASVKTVQTRLRTVRLALIHLAEKNLDILVPGLTHAQHGQPIRWSQTVLAHAQAFARDQERLQHVQTRCLDALPLGAAAFSGSHLTLDFEALAHDLGFAKPCQNGYDAVGDRDFILEALNAYALMATHLGRLCEEILYASSSAVGLLALPRDWSTGSSIMPNKRNPDVPELTRAKAARLLACASEGLTLVKSVLPSYGSDLHELKRTFLRAQTELEASLQIFAPFLQNLHVVTERADALLKIGDILATDIANAWVDGGMPFREAYQKAASLVSQAQAQGKSVHEMVNDLDFTTAIERRLAPGGTAKARIEEQIKWLKEKISNENS